MVEPDPYDDGYTSPDDFIPIILVTIALIYLFYGILTVLSKILSSKDAAPRQITQYNDEPDGNLLSEKQCQNDELISEKDQSTGDLSDEPDTWVDLDDPEAFDRILAEATNADELQERNVEGERLFFAPSQQTPYSGWAKAMWSNDQVKFLKSFRGGKHHGQGVLWHKNGQKISEYSFKGGKRDGLFRTWMSDGNLLSEKQYQNDELISEKDF